MALSWGDGLLAWERENMWVPRTATVTHHNPWWPKKPQGFKPPCPCPLTTQVHLRSKISKDDEDHNLTWERGERRERECAYVDNKPSLKWKTLGPGRRKANLDAENTISWSLQHWGEICCVQHKLYQRAMNWHLLRPPLDLSSLPLSHSLLLHNNKCATRLELEICSLSLFGFGCWWARDLFHLGF